MTSRYRFQKHFTPDEASRMLPLVTRISRDVVSLYAELSERQERLAAIRQRYDHHDDSAETPYSEEFHQMERQLERDAVRLEGFSQEIEQLGAQIGDVPAGTIDFPALLDGREVLLCWSPGETEVAHWHEVGEDVSHRTSVYAEITPPQAGH